MRVEKVNHAAGERCELTMGKTTYVLRPEEAQQLAKWIQELWPLYDKRVVADGQEIEVYALGWAAQYPSFPPIE